MARYVDQGQRVSAGEALMKVDSKDAEEQVLPPKVRSLRPGPRRTWPILRWPAMKSFTRPMPFPT